MLSPKIMIIVFCLCKVAVLANQDGIVLYQLFVDAVNFDKAQIGNVTMFATVSMFLVNSIFKKKMALNNKNTLLIIAFSIMAFAFLCFALNDTIL